MKRIPLAELFMVAFPFFVIYGMLLFVTPQDSGMVSTELYGKGKIIGFNGNYILMENKYGMKIYVYETPTGHSFGEEHDISFMNGSYVIDRSFGEDE